MSKFRDNIQKIARSAEIEAKIKNLPKQVDKSAIGSERGVGLGVPIDTCPLFYAQAPNSFDIAELLAGTAGPTISDPCSRLDTITGLTDFDTSEAIDSEGATVFLIIQVDGVYE